MLGRNNHAMSVIDMTRCVRLQGTQVAFTSFFTGDITYTALITMPPQWATIDYLEIQLWAGRMAFLSQVRTQPLLQPTDTGIAQFAERFSLNKS